MTQQCQQGTLHLSAVILSRGRGGREREVWVEKRERESCSGLSKKTNRKENSQTAYNVPTELVGIKQQLLLPSSIACSAGQCSRLGAPADRRTAVAALKVSARLESSQQGSRPVFVTRGAGRSWHTHPHPPQTQLPFCLAAGNSEPAMPF